MRYLAGIDIGGTKCAVTLGVAEKENMKILCKQKIATQGTPSEILNRLTTILEELLNKNGNPKLSAIGISCGGPMDAEKGLILSPPNLQDWKKVDVITPFREKFCVPTALQNDANACALAEWLYGAGKGTKNMIFLTFGTGLGAGLILDGKLYSGTNDMAGEVGHVRLMDDGPEGYGKKGSFEGFCSGGGISRMAVTRVRAWRMEGKETRILARGQKAEEVTAEDVGIAAKEGDELALLIWEDTGKMLGRGLAMLMDLLNPQKIIIGSIFARQEQFLREPMEKMIEKEALSYTRAVCEVVPAGLGEFLGDYAALSVAESTYRSEERNGQDA